MKLNYHADTDSLYIDLSEHPSVESREVSAIRRIVGLDLNEVAPGANEADEWDANVGARLLYKMIGWALRSRR